MIFFIKKRLCRACDCLVYSDSSSSSRDQSHTEIIQPTDVYIQPGLPELPLQWWELCAGLECFPPPSLSALVTHQDGPDLFSHRVWSLRQVLQREAPQACLCQIRTTQLLLTVCGDGTSLTSSASVGRLQKQGNVPVLSEVGFFCTVNRHCQAHRLSNKHLCRHLLFPQTYKGGGPRVQGYFL